MAIQNGPPGRAPAPGNNSAAIERAAMTSGAMAAKPGNSLMRLDTGVVTAMQVAKPRSLVGVKSDVVDEAAMAGDDFYYAWTTNNKDGSKGLVEGVSIDGAMILYRNWGNCDQTIDIYDETPTHWTFRAAFIDWEKGITVPRLFRQRKKQDTGMKDADRQADIVFQIGQSKAIRNAVVKAMPPWLIRAAIDAAKNACVEKFKDVPRSLHELRKTAASFGVTDDELMKKLGKRFTVGKNTKGQATYPDVGGILPRDLARIAAIFRAIDQQQTSVEVEFRGAAPPPEEPETEVLPATKGEPPEDDTDFGGTTAPEASTSHEPGEGG